ncbi:MAG: Trm112 family protein [Acidimicrobiales bacterium]
MPGAHRRRAGPDQGDLTVALDPKLLEILACPEDHGPLLYFADEDALYNPRLKRRYAITDDIPIMLIDEAVTVDDAEHTRLMAKAEAEGIKPTFDPSETAAG